MKYDFATKTAIGIKGKPVKNLCSQLSGFTLNELFDCCDDEKYTKWKYDDLPILPEHWQYQVSASTKKQFGILKKLMQRKDVESLICATDAG